MENHLIALLPGQDRARLHLLAERVALAVSDVLCEPGEVTRHVYFPVEGFVSLVAPIDGKPGLEVGMVGFEGMLGAQLALGVPTAPLHAVVQSPGFAWRVEAHAFCDELARQPVLQAVLRRYIYVLMAQLSTSATCLRFHRIEQRLARWLLMCQDRARSASFHATHESLAYVLGVRRVSVTTAAGALQRCGLIKYQHGEVTLVDRPGLQAKVCACYAADRAAYAGLLL